MHTQKKNIYIYYPRIIMKEIKLNKFEISEKIYYILLLIFPTAST